MRNFNYHHFRKVIFMFFIVFLFTFALQAHPDEIEIKYTGISRSFVKPDDKIYEEPLAEFIKNTGVNGNIELWETFKSKLDTSAKKGISGEVAAKFFFKDLGYKVLEEHYNYRIDALKGNEANEDMKTDATCTTKKGPDNGIDGIFILANEDFENPSHIVINEAKFRNKLSLSANTDFGFVEGGIQQSHSNWNRSRFSWPTCLVNLNYDEQVIVRTATLLDNNGTLQLYEVRDKDGQGILGEYASESSKESIVKAYHDNITAKVKKSSNDDEITNTPLFTVAIEQKKETDTDFRSSSNGVTAADAATDGFAHLMQFVQDTRPEYAPGDSNYDYNHGIIVEQLKNLPKGTKIDVFDKVTKQSAEDED